MANWSRDMVSLGTDEILLKTVNPGQIFVLTERASRVIEGR